jgi:serine/threonine-protein kinase
MSTPVGTLLSGRYRLDQQVGVGGMARVYRAFDTLLERPVAIKMLNREVAADSDQLERFRREARAVAQLSHPHIVTVIDAGDDGDPTFPTPYIVFEYVEGETLKERIRRCGRLDIPEAVAYAIEIARALGAAHERKIVHRDVKPQNVLINNEGRASITDFGIARTLTEEGLTADGRVLGTTDYVSPEQALGQAVNGQSDVYSLGIVLFEMLTGDVPFHAPNQVAVAMKHVREDLPDVQSRRPEISAALASVVDRATTKDLARRYPSAQAMINDLEEALAIETARSGHATGEATTVLRTLPGKARRRLPLRVRYPSRTTVLALAALALVAGAVAWLAASRTHRGTGTPVNVSVPGSGSPVPLGQNAAHDYNPFGTDREHPNNVGDAVDNDPNTFWSTFHYNDNKLGGKPGTGLYVDAQPEVVARTAVIQTGTPGFDVQVWGAHQISDGDRTKPLDARGWTRLGDQAAVGRRARIPLDTAGHPFRYYLAWITKLPPGINHVEIAEFTLLK